ncbi:MAG: M20/M25/M40 family metallo-hydrolase [Chloroflexi bacterium]|nr:M20/M25/M40 family metallo-hydrolase [Chloroflexota bacterium]
MLARLLVDAKVQLKGDLILTFVADEEYASIGTEDIVKHYTADAAIVTEPTGFGLCIAHRGFIWYEVETFGRAAHGSLYKEGIDANMRMGRFLAELDKLEQELRRREEHSLVGTPSLHAAQLQGGTELSAYAAKCMLRIERRLNPGETERQATAELQAIIDKLAAQDDSFKATLRTLFVRRPYETSASSLFIQLVANAVSDYHQQPASFIGSGGWTDAEVLGSAGIESMLLGPIGEGAHAVEEWVDLKSVEDLVAILFRIVTRYCGTDSK